MESLLEVTDKKKRLIKLKHPTGMDLKCQREKYRLYLIAQGRDLEAVGDIGFYVESLEAAEWLIIDPRCDNKYNSEKECLCRIATLLEVAEYIIPKKRVELLKGHLKALGEVHYHLRSLSGSKGVGNTLSNLCTECLLKPGEHGVKLLDLIAIKTGEMLDFLEIYPMEMKAKLWE